MASESKPAKTCFVICPIGPDDSEIRRWADDLLDLVIKPIVADFGYTTVRADKIPEPGRITSQVIEHLEQDELVIADLTGHNPNVFYELAVRHVTRKPIVMMIEQDQTVPFDVAPERTIRFTLREIRSYERCKGELRAAVQACENGEYTGDNPIASAMDLRTYRDSGDPAAESNAAIIEMLQRLRAEVAALGGKLSPHTDSLSPKLLLPDVVGEFERKQILETAVGLAAVQNRLREAQAKEGALLAAMDADAMNGEVITATRLDELERCQQELRAEKGHLETLLAQNEMMHWIFGRSVNPGD